MREGMRAGMMAGMVAGILVPLRLRPGSVAIQLDFVVILESGRLVVLLVYSEKRDPAIPFQSLP